ncbi:MAG: RhuM family protein [Rhodoferax sp.]|nr:RhuM family protein [Rhodoferax sp.]
MARKPAETRASSSTACQVFGKDYFNELLGRIRERRARERHSSQKITAIYALSTHYDKSATLTKAFFATVQNKLHWAMAF